MACRGLVILTLLSALGVLSWDSVSQPLYRWVDDQGEVHYGDQIPPAYANKERARLSEQGIPIETQPAPLTAEERARVRELERRQAEDERLLKQYRTVEELELARDGQLATIEATIQSKRDQIRYEMRNLVASYEEMQRLQKTDAPVPLELLGKIDSSMTNIRDGYTSIIDNEYLKQRVQEQFALSIERFRQLRHLTPPDEFQKAAGSRSTAANLVSCRDQASCHTYWERAVNYVRAHSERKGEVMGPGLLIAFQQDEREVRTLALSWTQKASDQPVQIYLDIQCKQRLTASLICLDPNVPRVREGFRAAVMGK